MTNITVFGKPRAFESYDYVFGGESSLPVENVHREPILKPKSYDDSVLHYFVKDNQAGLEYYKRVRGFESDRDGIVFGMAIKSTTDFNIEETFRNVLAPFVEDFACAFLDGTNRFNVPSIIESLKGTSWSQNEINKIQSASNGKPIKPADKDILLLVADIRSISSVEHLIKEYSDVYIATNVEIFKDPINEVVLKQTNKQIYTIENGILKLITTAGGSNSNGSSSSGTKGGFFTNWIFKNPVPTGNREGGNVKTGGGENGGNSGGGSGITLPPKEVWFIATAVALIIVSACLFKDCNNSGNETNSGQETPSITGENTGSEQSQAGRDISNPGDEEPVFVDATSVRLSSCNVAIKNSWSLNPKIEPQNSSNVPSDITFEVSDLSIASVDYKTYTLKVIKRPNVDSQVTVTAFIDGKELGQQTYTIAKKVEEPNPPSGEQTRSNSQIPPYNGRPRTCTQYLSDLNKALDDGTYSPQKVQEECQKIINGVYGSEPILS